MGCQSLNRYRGGDFISDEIITSDGEAFLYSGRKFDKMGKQHLVVKTPWSEVNEELAESIGTSAQNVSKILTSAKEGLMRNYIERSI